MGDYKEALAKDIYRELEKGPVVDTHEHLPWSEDVRDRDTDFLKEYLLHYMSSDIISSGMPRAELDKVTDIGRPIEERWRLVEPYWEMCRHTGYGRALDISVKGIYGIDGIHSETVNALNEAFLNSLKPGHFRWVLKDLCNIRVSILDGFFGGMSRDPALFRRVWQPLNYVTPMPCAGEVVGYLEETYRLSIRTLDDWMAAFDLELNDMYEKGAVALKFTFAYSRPLRFEKVDYSTASASFEKTIAEWEACGRNYSLHFDLPRDVQDFMVHYILKAANEKNLVIQIHTGLQEGNGNMLANSNPILLNNLFLEYPNVTFDLFHIGYPFTGTVSALCKNFPNVFIDMCWAQMISPSVARSALSDYIDAVPLNKISAFGGDYCFVDGIYGHLVIARENVSKVLVSKVCDGVFGIDRAIEIGKRLFFDNPLHIFRLENDPDITASADSPA